MGSRAAGGPSIVAELRKRRKTSEGRRTGEGGQDVAPLLASLRSASSRSAAALSTQPPTVAASRSLSTLASHVARLGQLSDSQIIDDLTSEVVQTLTRNRASDSAARADAVSRLLGVDVPPSDLVQLLELAGRVAQEAEAAARSTLALDARAADATSAVAGVTLPESDDESGDGLADLVQEVTSLSEDDDDDGDDDDGDDEDEDDGEDAEQEGNDSVSTNAAGTSAAVAATSTFLSSGVHAAAIGPHWLQQQVTVVTGIQDDAASLALADRLLAALALPDAADAEAALVDALRFRHFDFARQLVEHRFRIRHALRLARATDDADRAAIEDELRQTEEGRALLQELAEPSGRADRSDVSMPVATAEQRIAQHVRSSAESRRTLNLDDLAFQEGGHTMTNRSCVLPADAVKQAHRGYTSIRIPPPPKVAVDAQSLVDIHTSLPAWTHAAFAGMTSLNRMQSAVFPVAWGTSDNFLVAAPTGAGKTNVAVLSILAEVARHRDEESGAIDLDAFKCVYIAPMKALVQEVVSNFSKRLGSLNMVVKELSGDQTLSRQQLAETQLIVTTPEKWDIVTRKSGERSLGATVRLIIIDEIHLLHDARGPVLEAIVARTLRQVEASLDPTRIVGLSATLPNHEDVAAFLRAPPEAVFHFDSTYRPVPLQQTFYGINGRRGLKQMRRMDEMCWDIVREGIGSHASLVFVHSRKDTVKVASYLVSAAGEADLESSLIPQASSRVVLKGEASRCQNAELARLLPTGVAVHHAGLSKADRSVVEALFAAGHLQVLVCTATLAWGVNLPAHAVIVRGTQVYSPEAGGWQELSPMDIMQMFGRAGRPQFDTTGDGYLLTSTTELQYYMSLLNEQLPIESQLVSRLADMLNGEVALGTVASVEDGVDWLGYTYLYVCMLRNPTLYGFAEYASGAEVEDETMRRPRADLIHSAALILDAAGLVVYQPATGMIRGTDLGRIASHYYITHPSITRYTSMLRPTLSDVEMFRLFAASDEFRHMSVRREELVEVEELVSRVPIPIAEPADEGTAKVNVLLQAYLSGLTLDGFALLSDMVYITQSAARIVRALAEIARRRGWAQLFRSFLELAKEVGARQWAAQSPLRQLRGTAYELPQSLLTKVERRGTPLARLQAQSADELAESLSVPAAQARDLADALATFPRFQLDAAVQPLTRALFAIELTILPRFTMDPELHGRVMRFHLVVEDVDGEHLLHHEWIYVRAHRATDEIVINFSLPVTDPPPPLYMVHLISDTILAPAATLALSFSSLVLPTKFPAPTPLRDVALVPVSALRDERMATAAAAAMGRDVGDASYNLLQSNVFDSLFHTDDHVLLCAPGGSGKSLVAETAFYRALGAKQSPADDRPLAVYVVPVAAIADRAAADWNARLGDAASLGLTVARTTGEGGADNALVGSADILVATPAHFDSLTARWSANATLRRRLTLVMFDEVQLVGSPRLEHAGATLEVCVSRARRLSAQAAKEAGGRQIRLVALASSVANYGALAEWMGVSVEGTFGFHQSARPYPAPVSVVAVEEATGSAGGAALISRGAAADNSDAAEGGTSGAVAVLADSDSLSFSLVRPLLTRLAALPAGSLSVVFVPSARTTRLLAKDLVTSLHDSLLNCPLETITPALASLSTRSLVESLSFGIGLVHRGLAAGEADAVEALARAGHLGVVVASADSAWSLNLQPSFVAVLGTQCYRGATGGMEDYPAVDVDRMVSRVRVGSSLVLTSPSRRATYSRFLTDPMPVESQLDVGLAEALNSAIVAGDVRDRQGAVDWLTWTLYFQRLRANPNFYGILSVSSASISEHLSELVEDAVDELREASAISVRDDEDDDDSAGSGSDGSSGAPDELSPLNAGRIAAFYGLRTATIGAFVEGAKKVKGPGDALALLASAEELQVLAEVTSTREADELRRLARHAKLPILSGRFDTAETKANLVLQAHLSRLHLVGSLAATQDEVVPAARRLLLALVDVAASVRVWPAALAAMQLSQMITQAVWNDERAELLQLTGMGDKEVDACLASKVESVADVADLEEEDRRSLLSSLDDAQYRTFAECVNRFPEVTLGVRVMTEPEDVVVDGSVRLALQLVREEVDTEEEAATLGPVPAPYFPQSVKDGFWVLVGVPGTGVVCGIKRFASVGKRAVAALDVALPEGHLGPLQMSAFCVADSWIGADDATTVDVVVLDDEEASESTSEQS